MSLSRSQKNSLFKFSCQAVTAISLLVLVVLLYHIMKEGFAYLNFDFLNHFPSRRPSRAGIKSALFGSLWIMGLTAMIAIPVGVCTALFLEEYTNRKNKWVKLVELNISNLAGVPSIVYGLLGLTVFVRFLGMDRSLIAGALTLSLLILPVIVVTTQGALRAVPDAIRYGAYALGARRYHVVFGQVLPAAIPGIMTGVILSMSRAIGESAPLIMVGALSFVAFTPESITDPFTVLPVQIYNWVGRPQEAFHGLAAAGIIVLLAVLFTFNIIAVFIREKFQRYKND
ncbi:MAG: phosphate ABC transporter permease PstA [Bdellovibrionaceae bacterium]|jgi:phosphate transport system permease protein|nr:phosphate ABC transporter permease PstA [Pseudobdellovibrionaceae bacterium]